MASKSRLGKGLGALFPTLPGEEPVAEQPAMIAEDSSTPEATADITPAKKATAQQESKPAAPQTVSSSKAAKKAAGKRASMPALDTITHPSDLFFGTEKPQTGKVAAPQQGGK
ncbi:MAG: chromosome partitioning protein ParB, partial [Bifidobacterium longum]|nr:chromosome partitioning protein ParB [Bifidobacterium longum]